MNKNHKQHIFHPIFVVFQPALVVFLQDLHGAPGGENGERPCGRIDGSWNWQKWRTDEAPKTETTVAAGHFYSPFLWISHDSGQIIATHDLTPNGGLVLEIPWNPLISGKSRLVKYYNLARWFNGSMVIFLSSRGTKTQLKKFTTFFSHGLYNFFTKIPWFP